MFILKKNRSSSYFQIRFKKRKIIERKLTQRIISRSSKPTSTFELNHLEFRGKDENLMKEIMKTKSV